MSKLHKGLAMGGPDLHQTSRWPARLDLIQGLTGVALVLFMWTHMILVSSILISKDAMYTVARLFEGSPLLEPPQPVLVSLVALAVFLLMLTHGVLAVRKIPASYREYQVFWQHSKRFGHADTTLWLVQVVTGFVLMFLAGIHLYQMFSQPSAIGPYASADRVWSEHLWPLYLVLLFAVELHGGIGLYRWLLKWDWFNIASQRKLRHRLQIAKWAITGFFIVLGLITLAAYMKIGMEHADQAGERYHPSHACISVSMETSLCS
jgi:fumarate reductase subunit C